MAKPTGKGKRAFVAPLKKYAFSLPGAYEDHPWGESVAKVAKKVFVFFGHEDYPQYGLSVKLPQSRMEAMHFPFTEPTGYGLGKSGWVTVRLDRAGSPDVDMLREWIEESYRAVAPKKLIAELEARRLEGGAKKKPTPVRKRPAIRKPVHKAAKTAGRKK